MEQRKTLILNILLLLSLCYATYIFVVGEIYVTKLSLQPQTTIKEFKNPLSEIFIGDGNSGYHYKKRFREKSFLTCAMYVLFLFGFVRYYLSGRQKIRGLLYVLMAHFFGYTASLFYVCINIALLMLNSPTHSGIPLVTDTNFWINGLGLHFLGWVLLYFPIKILIDALKPTQNSVAQILPLKPMRVFHSLNDRIILFIALNVLFWQYFRTLPESFWTKTVLFDTILVASYFVVEWLYKISPGKVLTGTHIASSDDKEAVSVGQIALRSLTRLIPFEFLSFLGQKGWHDHVSKTTLVYSDTENWLSRQSRLLKTAAFCLNALAFWLFVGSIFALVNRDSRFDEVTGIPSTMILVFLLLMSVLFVSWLSSVSAFVQMLAYDEDTEGGYNIKSILSWWIPLMHFTEPAKTLSYIVEDFEKIAENRHLAATATDKIKVTSQTLSKGFGFFYTATLLSVVGYYFINWHYETYITYLLLSCGVMCFCFVVSNYAQAIKDFSNQIN